ncbi:MAG TPA: wax ester/triacylglycerol synthase family O-acyltransferase [Kofleriaceae bacterium]|nr:wax ester/triacylglycerol synthase family O-acyltransferase [Kofleriaceae bacterium]
MKPLSPTDAMFLWLEGRRQPMHVAGMQLYTPPDGAPDDFVRRLVEAWREHIHARQPFDERVRFRLGHWFWEEDSEFELDYHLRHSALPRPGRVRELLALVSRLHGTLMDRTRPLWECNVIEGLADGRVALYVKIHHAMMDGIGAMRLMQNLLSADPTEKRPPLWAQDRPRRAPREPDGEAPSPGLLERALAAGAEIVPGIQSGLREIVRNSDVGDPLAQPFHAPPTMFNVRISGSRRFAAQSYELARVKAIGKATGATVNDVTLAVCAGALRRYLDMHDALPDRPLIAMVPVSVRSADNPEGGNQISILLANLATHLADPLERLRVIVESTSSAKSRLAQMSRLERVAHAAAMSAPMGPSMITGYAKRRPIYNVVISNVPGPTERLYLDGMRLDETYPLSIPVDYLALNITIASYAGQMGFGYTACRRSVPALQRMLDHTDESIAELEDALGFSAPRAIRT